MDGWIGSPGGESDHQRNVSMESRIRSAEEMNATFFSWEEVNDNEAINLSVLG